MLIPKAATLLRLAREDAGMTQAELAAAAGIQQPTISAYESGAKAPRVDTLRRILSAAHIRPSMPLMVYADDILLSAKAHGLSDVRVFGSTVRGLDDESSDIDLLVSPSESTSLFDLAGFAAEIENLTGFRVDVLTDRQAANPLIAHVLEEAVPL